MHSMTFVSSPMTTRRKANADFKYANLIIGNSKSLKKSLMNRFPKHKKKIRFVHLGVDTKKFYPRSKSSLKSFHLLFAGRLISRKGVPVLLRAFKLARKSVPSLRLSIAGGTRNPAYKAFLKKAARRLNVPVRFKGNLPRNKMPQFYRSGHCIICPSQKHEAFGLVNVEAMACGLPVIASATEAYLKSLNMGGMDSSLTPIANLLRLHLKSSSLPNIRSCTNGYRFKQEEMPKISSVGNGQQIM